MSESADEDGHFKPPQLFPFLPESGTYPVLIAAKTIKHLRPRLQPEQAQKPEIV